MAMNLNLLGLQLDSPLANPAAKNFRPPIWPPPPDWAPIVDAKGDPQCVYADSAWPLDVWQGSPLKINFGDGATKGARIDPANADIFRQCAVWLLWGPRGCRAASTFFFKVGLIKPLFVACTEQGILATDVMRFEAVIDDVAARIAPSSYDSAISVFHDLLDAKEHLGFCLLDRDGLARLSRLAPAHDARQTPYIPSRIWSYQLTRLRDCLEDYAKHSGQIEACFQFCLDAYAHNFGSLKEAVTTTRSGSAPFQNRKSGRGMKYHGPLRLTTDRFGVTDLIETWLTPFSQEKGEKQIGRLSQYLDLVSAAGLAYLLNFSLMRVDEAWTLRSDCLLVENDESFGDIHMLRGETTKTDTDSDARWPVSKSASLAVDAMKHIAALRMRCARAHDKVGVTPEDEANPYLISYQYEPWSNGKHKPYRLRPKAGNYRLYLRNFPQLLEVDQLVINEEDLRIARLMTPSLDEEVFKVGRPWNLTWHQLRRTGAVNMLSSEMVDESSLQMLLKHQSRVMTLYYGRNHARLALNEDTRILFLKTMYQEIGRDLRKLSTPRFVSPLGSGRKETIVMFIKEADASALEKAARFGKLRARRIRAGFCVNHLPCPYGGIEAISHCLGTDGSKGCPDLMLDIERTPGIQLYEKSIDEQFQTVHPDSPRHRSLHAEKQAIGRFYDVVQAQDR